MNNHYQSKNLMIEESDDSYEEIISAQLKLIEFLKIRINKYMMGDSSSIPKEEAEELLASLCYTLDIDNIQDIKSLINDDINNAFERGIKQIENKNNIGKKLWQKACLTAPSIENISYKDTLKSIGGFWKSYDYKYYAHQIPCDIDYQLIHPVPESLKGIDYINAYLQNIVIENTLISRFDSEKVIELLKIYYKDYRGLLINIYEPVALNLIGNAIINNIENEISMNIEIRGEIEKKLKNKSSKDVLSILDYAVHNICLYNEIVDKEQIGYLEQFAINHCPIIMSALEHNNLHNVFCSVK